MKGKGGELKKKVGWVVQDRYLKGTSPRKREGMHYGRWGCKRREE